MAADWWGTQESETQLVTPTVRGCLQTKLLLLTLTNIQGGHIWIHRGFQYKAWHGDFSTMREFHFDTSGKRLAE